LLIHRAKLANALIRRASGKSMGICRIELPDIPVFLTTDISPQNKNNSTNWVLRPEGNVRCLLPQKIRRQCGSSPEGAGT
jgi:hypothetical protein